MKRLEKKVNEVFGLAVVVLCGAAVLICVGGLAAGAWALLKIGWTVGWHFCGRFL